MQANIQHIWVTELSLQKYTIAERLKVFKGFNFSVEMSRSLNYRLVRAVYCMMLVGCCSVRLLATSMFVYTHEGKKIFKKTQQSPVKYTSQSFHCYCLRRSIWMDIIIFDVDNRIELVSCPFKGYAIDCWCFIYLPKTTNDRQYENLVLFKKKSRLLLLLNNFKHTW